MKTKKNALKFKPTRWTARDKRTGLHIMVADTGNGFHWNVQGTGDAVIHVEGGIEGSAKGAMASARRACDRVYRELAGTKKKKK